MSQHIDNEFMLQHLELYLNDLCNIFSVDYVSQMSQEVRVNVTRWLVEHQSLVVTKESSANTQLSYWHIALVMNSELLAAELQLLHMYQQATGNDPVELLMSIIEPYNSRNDASVMLGLSSMVSSSEDEQSITSDDVLDASDVFSECSEDSEDSQAPSFVSALGSNYTDIDSSGDDEQKEVTIKYQLVSHVCKSLLPTQALLEQCQGQENWVRRVNNILLLAASIEVRPKELHYLHLCKDFVNLLALPNNLSDGNLATLGELIFDIDDNTLDCEKILQFVIQTIQLIQERFSTNTNVNSAAFVSVKVFWALS